MEKKNRWLILIACIVINLCLGLGYAWSVFQGPLIEEFGWTTAQASLAFSISFAVVPLAMVINGPRQDREGPKRITFVGGILFGVGMILTGFTKSLTMLYITYGVMLGAGIGMAYGCTTITSVKWFPDKKGLAGGLSAAGFGSGAIIFAPVASSLIGKYGVLFTFRVLGIITLIIICFFALMLSHPKAVTGGTVATTNDVETKKMIGTFNFWNLWLIYVIGCIGGLMIIGHASPIAREHIGLDAGTATLVVSIVAMANTGGRLFWGAVSDKIGRYNTVIVMFIASSIGLFLLMSNMSSILAIIGIIAIALSFGGFLGSYPGITVENWGARFSGTNYGVMFTAFGIASLVGPRMAAVMKENNNGEYGQAFLISIILGLVGIALMFYYKTVRLKRKTA